MKLGEIISFIIALLLTYLLAQYGFYNGIASKNAYTSDIAVCDYNVFSYANSYDELSMCNTIDPSIIEYYDGEVDKEYSDPATTRRFISFRQCCDEYNKGTPLSYDIYKIYFEIMNNLNIPIFATFIILFFALKGLNKKFKSKFVHYYVQRKGYKSFVVRTFLSTYKYALLIPFIYLISYLNTLTITNHTPIDAVLHLKDVQDILSYVDVNGFWICYVLAGVLAGMIVVNLGLIAMHRNRKFIFVIIEAFIGFFILSLIDEKFFSSNFLNYFAVIQGSTIYRVFLTELLYFIITFGMAFFLYRDQIWTLSNMGGES